MKVSVIIPCFNCAAFVAKAIDSSLQQSYQDIEILLIDNNSSDNTLAVLTQYEQQHPKKIRVFQELKKGASAARNKGLAEATGEWIQFLDADNELEEEKIAHQVSVGNLASADIVIGDRVKVENTDGSIRKWVEKADVTDPWLGLITSRLNSTSANLWRKTAVQKVGGYTETLETSEDYELIFKLLKADAVVVHCPGAETIVHIRQNSLSRSTDKTRACVVLSNAIRLRLSIKAYLKSTRQLTGRRKQVIDRYLLERFRSMQRLDREFAKTERKKIGFEVAASAVILDQTRALIKRFF